MLYKLWSGFTKNLRYLLLEKSRSAVRIPRFGTLRKEVSSAEEVSFTFSGSHELAQHIECPSTDEGADFSDLRASQQGIVANPDWFRIAQVSDVQNGDIAKMLIQQTFAMAVMHARDGNHVSLNLKLGQLAFQGGTVKFISTK